MKRRIYVILMFFILFFIVWSKRIMLSNIQLTVTAGVFLILIASYLYFERSSMDTKEIAVIAALSSFAAFSRITFAVVPNVKPATFLIAISGLIFGPVLGFLIGATSTFVSNIFLGQGPWTLWQMFSFGIVGWISGVMGSTKKKPEAKVFAIICFLYGFLYDWVMNLWYVLGYIKPLTLKAVSIAYLTGITFNIMHATGNFIFCLIFYESFYKILSRFKKRLQITYQ